MSEEESIDVSIAEALRLIQDAQAKQKRKFDTLQEKKAKAVIRMREWRKKNSHRKRYKPDPVKEDWPVPGSEMEFINALREVLALEPIKLKGAEVGNTRAADAKKRRKSAIPA